MSEVTEFQIARLELRPGDVLVVRAPLVSMAQAATVRGLMPPGVRVMFTTPDVDLSVLTRAEIEALP